MDALSPRAWRAVLLGWAALVPLVLTWPVLTDPLGLVVGHPRASVGAHVWVMWWARHHPAEWFTDLLFFPIGGDVVRLYGSDLLGPLLIGSWCPSPVLAHNLWAWVLIALGLVGAAHLARVLGATRGGALAAGTAFAAAPFFQHELLNGTTELLSAAALPWFTATLLRLGRRPRPALGAALGVITALATLASAYNPFFLLLIGIGLRAHAAARQPGPVLPAAFARALGVGVAVAAGPIAALLALHAAHGAGQTLARREDWLTQDPPLPDSFADLLAWVDPREIVLPATMPLPGGASFEYWTTCTVYLGAGAVLLAILGLWSRRRALGRGPLEGLLLVGAVAGLLAMGPVLRVGGEALRIGGLSVPLPAPTVALLFPPFVLTALHAYRYASVVVLALSAFVGLGARRAIWAPILLLEAVLLSPVPFPAATTPAPGGAALDALAAAPPGAVLVAPTVADDLHDLGRALLVQTVVGKPIQDGGIHHRAGEGTVSLFKENAVLAGISRMTGAALPSPAVARFFLGELHGLGFRYLLVPADAPGVQAQSAALLGAPVADDGTWAWWALPAPAAAL